MSVCGLVGGRVHDLAVSGWFLLAVSAGGCAADPPVPDAAPSEVHLSDTGTEVESEEELEDGVSYLYAGGAFSGWATEDLIRTSGGLWAVGRSMNDLEQGPVLLWLAETGEVVAARELDLAADFQVRLAPLGEGVVMALIHEGALVLVAVDGDLEVSWAREVPGPASWGDFEGEVALATNDSGIFVAAGAGAGSQELDLLSFDLEGQLKWARGIHGGDSGLVEVLEQTILRTSHTVPRALVADADGVLVVAQTSSFTERWYHPLLQPDDIQFAEQVWMLSVDAAGELRWQSYLDLGRGTHTTVHAVQPDDGGWLLGGEVLGLLGDGMSERPFLARVADDGTPSFTQSLDSAWSGRVDGFFETTDGWSALVATGSGLFTAVLGPRTDPTVDYQDERVWNLSDVLGRVAPGAGVLTYVGAAPACSDTPYFCEERRGLFTAASEHQGASTCGGGLWRDPGPVDEVEVEFEFPTVLRPDVVPADRLSQLLVQEVSPELVAVALEPQRLCQEAGSSDVAVLP